MKAARSMPLLAALFCMASLSALAQTTATSPTRADVQKEAIAAGKAGQISSGECSPEQKADAGACAKKPVTSTKTRDEVKKEAVAAGKSGKIEHGEAAAAAKADKGTSVAARADVKQEAVAAGKKGEIVKGEAQPDMPKK